MMSVYRYLKELDVSVEHAERLGKGKVFRGEMEKRQSAGIIRWVYVSHTFIAIWTHGIACISRGNKVQCLLS